MVLGRIRDLMMSSSSGGCSGDEQVIHIKGSKNNKSYIRLSSSLQDFTSYHHHNHHDHNDHDHDQAAADLPQLALPCLVNNNNNNNNNNNIIKNKKKKKCVFLFGVLVFVILIFLFLHHSSSLSSKYFVVLDSGSTGTRVYVYEASPSPFLISQPPLPSSLSARAYRRVETEPGLHTLLHNSSALKAAIRPLLRWAQNQIPSNAHKSTSLFLYATAGLRRLPPPHSKWILDNAWAVLHASPFQCRRQWVRIVTGTEEAYLGWIALNHHTRAHPTFGALDLGGSSLQVTFETDDAPTQNSLNLRIGNVNHHLTAYSLPGYGLNDAFDKSVARLVQEQGSSSVKHPCLHSGYAEPYTCSHCATNGKGVSLLGAPNWEQCTALARVAVNASEWSGSPAGMDCEVQPCALGDAFPRPYGKFYGMSGFYVVFKFFNLTPEATLDEVVEKGRTFCHKTWEDAKSSVAPQPFIEQYCFRAPYIVSLLRQGLQIKDDQILIGSGSITWTLGVAVLEAGNAFSSTSYKLLRMKMKVNPILLLLGLSLVLLACALWWVGKWRRPNFLRRASYHHLPLFRHNSAGSLPSVLRFQRWSPINSGGDGRAKSPTIGGSGSSITEIQLMESSSSLVYPTSTSSVGHSYSSNNLGQMQFDAANPFWAPHRTQMSLQSRRSQSREDLHSSLPDPHMLKP